MTYSSKIVTPALIAVALYAFSPAQAGIGKNGEGEDVSVTQTETQVTDKNGGDTDKNGGGSTDGKNGTDDTNGTNGTTGTNGKNGDGGDRGGGGRHHYSGGGGGGGGGVIEVVSCVVNGKVFRVRNIRECGYAPRYHGGGQVYHYQKRQKRQVYRQTQFYQGGYEYAPQPRMQYVRPASRAAIMQTQKRERHNGGIVLGYAYGGDYGYQQGCGCEAPRVVRHKKKQRRAAMRMQYQMDGYGQQFDYNPGYVIHYGPTMQKDGGY